MTAHELFVPGRLCLFGEHSDWAGAYRRQGLQVETGRCLITGTDQGIHARVEPCQGFFEFRSVAPSGHVATDVRYPAEPAALQAVAQAGGFESYAAGVAHHVLHRHEAGGLRIEAYRSTLPLGKGLSSSAAISVLTARAFSRAYDLGLSVEEEMDLAYHGETLTGSACGRMDQACAYGQVPVLLQFDGDEMTVERLAPGADLHFLVVDLCAAKDTRRILADLNAAFLAGDPGVRRALGSENHRLLRAACQALVTGDAATLGALMIDAQETFDRLVAPACPAELTAPKLHAVLAHPAASETSFGGKGIGSQGDGTAQFLCRGSEARRELATLLMRDLDVTCFDLTIPRSRPEPSGADPAGSPPGLAGPRAAPSAPSADARGADR